MLSSWARTLWDLLLDGLDTLLPMAGVALACAALAGCGWKGSPKVPTGKNYEACMKACDPGGACIPKGKGWECLPPAVPVVPAEDGL